LRTALVAATKEIDSAITDSLNQLLSENKDPLKGSFDLFKIFRFPRGKALQLARAAEIYEKTLENIRKIISNDNRYFNASRKFNFEDVLSEEYVQLLSQLSDCMAHRITPNCTDICYHSKYRTIDGSCNNLKNPTWGSSLSSFQRYLPPEYENKFRYLILI
jgi:peroxidase